MVGAASSSAEMRYPSDMMIDTVEPWIRYEVFKFTPKKGNSKGGSGFQNKPVVGDILYTIALPFDQQLGITNSQKWNPSGELASAAEIGLSGDIFGIGRSWASSLQAGAARMGGSGSITGEALTDKVSLQYEGPEQRTFTLTHTMIPKSEDEEYQIQKILHTFRHSAAPEFKKDIGTATSYGFPNLFRIKWMLGSKPNNNIPQYDISYITSVDIKYGDDNFSRFKSGAPTIYEMTLSFTEMEFINKDHIAFNNL